MSYLGIDIGGTNLVIGIFDEEINLINKYQYPTKSIKNNYFKGLVSIIDDLNISDLQGIGLGVPGTVTKEGYILSLTNLKFEEHDLIKQMENYFKVPICIGNDANMAALGEYNYAQLEKNKVYCVITLGTGVGSGIIINGNLLIGNRGLAGEIGHLSIDCKKRFHCNCHDVGCCETIVSAVGFSNLYRYYKKYYPDSILHQYNRVNSRLIMEIANKKDPLALRIRNEIIYHLAKLCKEVSYVIDVDYFIIGGGISKNKNLVNMIQKRYLKMVNHEFRNTLFSKAILEDDAGIYGAAYYIKERRDEFHESY